MAKHTASNYVNRETSIVFIILLVRSKLDSTSMLLPVDYIAQLVEERFGRTNHSSSNHQG